MEPSNHLIVLISASRASILPLKRASNASILAINRVEAGVLELLARLLMPVV